VDQQCCKQQMPNSIRGHETVKGDKLEAKINFPITQNNLIVIPKKLDKDTTAPDNDMNCN
jgi:hypothetical protein